MAAAALTFGSVGDIITTCSIIRSGVDALSSSHGSAPEYQNLGKEILNLSRALVSVEPLLQPDVNLERRGDLKKIVDDCHGCLVRFLSRIEAFECLSWPEHRKLSGDHLKVLFRKLQWPSHKV